MPPPPNIKSFKNFILLQHPLRGKDIKGAGDHLAQGHQLNLRQPACTGNLEAKDIAQAVLYIITKEQVYQHFCYSQQLVKSA